MIAPVALVESIFGPRIYGWLYDLHPFRFDGQERYIGFRPLAFFENGNQYGIWVAATALAAVWLWQAERHTRARHAAVAVLSLFIALMSQSAGAILILFAGLALYYTAGWRLTRWLLPLMLLLAALGGALYWSGKIPVRAIAENTAVGREIVNFARATGRGSLTWRIARDQNALPVIRAHPIVGTGRWDWWKPIGERPWDLPADVNRSIRIDRIVACLWLADRPDNLCAHAPIASLGRSRFTLQHRWPSSSSWRSQILCPIRFSFIRRFWQPGPWPQSAARRRKCPRKPQFDGRTKNKRQIFNYGRALLCCVCDDAVIFPVR